MKTALVIIDAQNDFFLDNAPLRVAGAKATIPTIKKLLDTARERQWSVFFVVREHQADGTDAEAFRMPIYAQGKGACVQGTHGAAIVDELQPLPNEKIIRKYRFSAFFHTQFDLVLRRLGVQRLLIAGTQYPNCIRATAVDAMSYDYHVVIVTDACSAQNAEVVAANIRDMSAMGIECKPLSEILLEQK